MRKPNRSMTMILLAALLLACFNGLILADEDIDETRKADADATIDIDNLSGSVTLSGWDREEVKVTGTLGEGADALEIRGDGDRLSIEVVLPRNARHVEDTHLVVKVPQRARVRVGTVNADVKASDFAGRLHVGTVNGDVEVSDELEELEVESVSGDIDLDVNCDDLEVSSVSGEISLDGIRGEAAVETVSGDVELTAGTLMRFFFSTVSGDLEFRASLDEKGRYSFSSQSGSIRLFLPEKIDAEFEVSTFSGDIDNEFGPKAKKQSKYVPAKELEFSVGSGGAQVEIETFSGDVELIIAK